MQKEELKIADRQCQYAMLCHGIVMKKSLCDSVLLFFSSFRYAHKLHVIALFLHNIKLYYVISFRGGGR